jgi:hypothetical protein
MTTALQDGMLEYYLSQAGASDVNVAERIEKEPFDYRTCQGKKALGTGGGAILFPIITGTTPSIYKSENPQK